MRVNEEYFHRIFIQYCAKDYQYWPKDCKAQDDGKSKSDIR